MPCPICDEKPINCQCTEAELRMYYEIEELEERVPRWIPVSEQLPEEYKTVIVVKNGEVCAAEIRFPDDDLGMDEPWWMVFKDLRDYEWAGLVPMPEVTHWMPLPEPPTCP